MPDVPSIDSCAVLLADSSLYMRKLTRSMLMNSGVKTVHEVADGVAAIDAIRNLNPDVMIIDWDISVMSGPEVMGIVRSPDVFAKPNLPVIMLTDVGLQSRVADAVRLGVHEILLKPISPMALEQRLLSVLLAPRPMIRTGRYYVPLPHRHADLSELMAEAQ